MADFWFYLNESWQIIKLVLMIGWPFILLIWLFTYRKLVRRFPIEATIIEKRGNNIIRTNDRLGRIYEDGIHKYKFQCSKDTIPVMDYDWVLHYAIQNTSFFENIINKLRGNIGSVMIFKYGSKQYKPVKITVNGEEKMNYEEILNEKGDPIFINVYEPLDMQRILANVNFEVVDWDNMNFMVQEQRATLDRRQKIKDRWQQLMFPMSLVAVVLIIWASLYFGFNFVKEAWTQGASVVANNKASQQAQVPNIPIISNMLTPGT